ncbi:MAG: sigma-54-dependent Fis family transcriptional regulator [Calditrichaeota bacterium]|nr:MAG: sigma-54-dependent Fis family transcriptional regulator [Calditrichota bacterium]
MENYRILVVDDDDNLRMGIATMLEDEGFLVEEAENGREGIEKLDQSIFDLIITDYKMNEMDGMRFLKQLKKEYPSMKVIMITGYGSIEHAVEAMKLGAINYLPKPIKPKKLIHLVKSVLGAGEATELTPAQKEKRLQKHYHFHRMIGQSKPMQQVYRKIQEVASTDIPVLLVGESGTGKEMVAHAIHDLSARKNEPFVAVNTGAIPRELIASELFGHLKGAFTGAISDKKGKFEEANRGTLFLDEISTMSMEVQISLLRVLETQIIERVGSNRPIKVDVRIVTATNEDLQTLINRNEFREDLYYRLNVFTIELPPLRERKPDIPYLANFYRELFNIELGKNVSRITAAAMEALKKYSWPGNVRELRNVILRAVLTAEEEIDARHLPSNILKPGLSQVNITFKPGVPLSEVEKTMIIQTLKAVRGNKLKAANILGISRRSLYNKLEEYQIKDTEL